MASWLEWLLGLENIRLARDAPLLLQWDRQAPAWLIFIVAVAGCAFIAMVYRRERASLPRRITLAGCRGLLLGLVLAIFCKPSLVLQRNRVEPSYVALLVDTSASMAWHDAYSSADPEGLAEAVARGAALLDPADLERRSRLELLQSALTHDEASPIRQLLEKNGVQLAAFAAGFEPLAFAESPDAAGAVADALDRMRPDGFSTDLAGAITRTLEKSEGRRLAAIVIAGDGRATRNADLRTAVELAAGRQVPIYAVRLGSTVSPADVEVGPLWAAHTVFVHDMVAVEAQVSARGLAGAAEIELTLLDTSDGLPGEAVASEIVSLASDEETAAVELRAKPGRVGAFRYRVQARPLDGERNLKNNADQVDVNVTDDRLRVLYVEGYPRYEYRYLKNALLREKSLELSVLLLEADEQFVQEGTTPIRRFPDTPEELNRYDVVLFGDVDPRAGWLTQTQMLMLLDFVANEGGGFALLAGDRATPRSFIGTPLERLVPIVIDPAAPSSSAGQNAAAFRLGLTAEGASSRAFRFAATLEESRRMIEGLPELFWYARTLGPKPGATVYAEHPNVPNPRGPGGMPLVVVGQYGAGKIYFQGTDDTWRWRRHTGELLHDSYWVQVARELMRASRVSQDRRMVIKTDRRTYSYGSPVHVHAEVLDAQILRQHPEFIEIGLHPFEQLDSSDGHAPKPGAPAPPSTARIGGEQMVKLTRLSPESNLFEGSIVPSEPGRYGLQPVGHRPEYGGPAPVSIRVEDPDLEMRNPAADHLALERAAAATGGRVLDLDELDEGFASIPDRKLQVPDDVVEPLWDSRLVFGLFILMLSIEWTLRKAFGLM